MKSTVKKTLYWSPRVICILFAIFLSIFAMDVFGQGEGFWQTILALVMHLIPTFLIVVILILAWRWEWIGAIAFVILAILYPVVWGRFPIITYVIMTTPMWIIAILFALNWKYRGSIVEKS